MSWFGWLLALAIIIPSIIWTILPEKPVWLVLLIIVVMGSAVYIAKNFPADEDKEKGA